MSLDITKNTITITDGKEGLLCIDDYNGMVKIVVENNFDYYISKPELVALVAALNYFLTRWKD